MYTQKKQTKKDKPKAVAYLTSQRKHYKGQGFRFVDNRPGLSIQKKMIDSINNHEVQIPVLSNMSFSNHKNRDIKPQSVLNETIQRYVYIGAGSTKKVNETNGTVVAALLELNKEEKTYLKEKAIKELEHPIRAKDKNDLVSQVKEIYAFQKKYNEKGENNEFDEMVKSSDLYKNFQKGDRLYGVGGGTGSKGRGIWGSTIKKNKNKNKSVIIDELNTGVMLTPSKRKTTKYGKFLAKYEGKEKDPYVKGRKGKQDFTRLCKRGIDFTTEASGKTIHFVLDNFDVTGAPHKSSNSITLAELRHTYRQFLIDQKKLLGTPTANVKNIKFYLRGKEVPPPWETEPKLWEGYFKQLKEKEKTKIEAEIAQIEEEIKAIEKIDPTDEYSGVNEYNFEWYQGLQMKKQELEKALELIPK